MSLDAVAELSSPSSNSIGAPRILAVDDDRVTLMMLVTRLKKKGYDVLTAQDGDEALQMVKDGRDSIDVILLDREMPSMNGMEVVAKLKADPILRKIPIVMQTGADKPEQVKEGIDAGVFYYLTKPIQEELLNSVMTAAIREATQKRTLRNELQRHRTSFRLIDTSRFLLTTLGEAEDLACFIANCYPEPDRVLPGLAELLVNAVEHGNCGITYDEKTELVANGTWRDEVLRRATLPENAKKKVEVVFQKKEDGYYVRITDEGKGFDWPQFMQIDPARATDNHGRGIAQANMISFDAMDYNAEGNQVVAKVNLESGTKLDW